MRGGIDLPRGLKDTVDRKYRAAVRVSSRRVFVTLRNRGLAVGAIGMKRGVTHCGIDTFVNGGREAVDDRSGLRLRYPLSAARSRIIRERGGGKVRGWASFASGLEEAPSHHGRRHHGWAVSGHVAETTSSIHSDAGSERSERVERAGREREAGRSEERIREGSR